MSDSRRITDEDVTALGTLVSVAAKAVVRTPDAVTVEVDKSSHKLTVYFSTDPSDEGRVIGSGGTTIRAFHALFHAAARSRSIVASLVYRNDRNVGS